MLGKITENIADIMMFIFAIFAGLALLGILLFIGYEVHGYMTAPYIITANEQDLFIQQYEVRDGYYYATTISGKECKIPIDIAVVKNNSK